MGAHAKPKHIVAVTLPDDTEITKATKRDYTHVVAVLCGHYPDGGEPYHWNVGRWCQSFDTAWAARSEAKRSTWGVRETVVLETRVVHVFTNTGA